jgi:hypothetical protein
MDSLTCYDIACDREHLRDADFLKGHSDCYRFQVSRYR